MKHTAKCALSGVGVQFVLSALCAISLSSPVFGQRLQLIDDFNRADNAQVGNGWTEGGGNAAISGNMLFIVNATANGRDYVYTNIANKYTTTLASNSTTLAWAFNMQQQDNDPGGFAGGANGVAFVLGATTNDFNAASGYAVALGNGGGTDPIRLVRFAGGLVADANLTTILTFGDYGAQYMNIRVTYSNFQWRLYVTTNSTATFSDPSNVTTLVAGPSPDTTYTSNRLDYLGAFWNYAKNQAARFDNVYIPLGPSEIAVLATNRTTEIASGTMTPSAANGTDFGAVLEAGTVTATNYFAVTNSGLGELSISRVETSSTMGAAADFTVLSWPPVVDPGTISNLVIAFNPSAVGLRTAVVAIANSDTDEGYYTFAIQGTGSGAKIVVNGTNGALVASGNITPSFAAGTDYGGVLSDGAVSVTNVFGVTNSGTLTLTISAVTTASTMGAAADFAVLSLPETVSPGTRSNLVIRFDPGAIGLRTAVVTLANNDLTNGTYFFAVQGTGVAPSIAVYGTNGVAITNGNLTPRYTNGTDYGAVIAAGTSSRTNVFGIANTGNALLALSGVSTGSSMGADGDFTVLSWPATVSPGTTSNLVVRFDPTATGLRTAVVTVASSDYANGNYVFALQGTGTYAGILIRGTNGTPIPSGSLSPQYTNGTDFGAVNTVGSTSLTNTFAVTNFGDGPLFITSVSTSSTMGAAAEFTVLSYPATVSAGTVSNLLIRFDPAATGLRTALVTIASSDTTNGTYTFAVQGTGDVAAILVRGTNGVYIPSGSLTPQLTNGTDFGAVISDGTASLTNVFAVTNFGAAPLVLSSITTASTMGAAADFAVLSWPTIVSPGTVSNLAIRFDPAASGVRTAVVTIANNDATNGSYFFALKGTGVQAKIVVYGTNGTTLIASGNVTPSPASGTDFGALISDGNISLTNVFAVTNFGAGPLVISGITTASTMGAAADFAVLAWPAIVSPGTVSNLAIRFDPAASGVRTAVVTMANNDATNGSYFFAVKGTGVAPSIVVYGTNGAMIASGSMAPSTTDGTDYGQVLYDGAISLTNVFTITNAGNALLTISSVTTASTMAAGSDFNVLSWPATVSPGTKSNLVVRFNPSVIGLRTAVVYVASSDYTNGTYRFAIQGTGYSIEIDVIGFDGISVPDGYASSFSGDGTDFGSWYTTNSVSKAFSITNSGSGLLLISGVTTSGAHASDFVVLSYPSSVAPGTASNMLVQFTPQSTGGRTGTLIIANNDYDEATYDFLVHGVGLAPATPDDPDLPHPPTNFETIVAGSYIIPMGTNNQAIGSAPFNLKAYGLVMNLLRTNVPVKWAIAAGKVQDGVDFTGYVARIVPSTTAATNIAFRAGPFIVPNDYTNVAAPLVNSWSNNVAVYRLLSNTVADIRYTLTHKPKIAVLNDGGNTTSIQYYVLSSAGITSGIDFVSAVSLASTSCYTCATEPHFDGKNYATCSGQVVGARAFVQSGGNFLAQCAGVNTYEGITTGLFHTTKGIVGDNLTQTLTYQAPDLAVVQFQGTLDQSVGGSVPNWHVNTTVGSAFTNNAQALIQSITTTNVMQVAEGKLTRGARGSVVTYLGGHDYSKNEPALAAYNGERTYLNMLFLPATRPDSCSVNFGADLAISKDDGVATVTPGLSTNTYVIVVTNNGPGSVTNATITDSFPSSLTSITWACSAQNGATVTNTSGTGNINLQAAFPYGSWVVITARAVVAASPTYCALTNTATVTVSSGTVDPIPGNNTALDVDNYVAATIRGQVRQDIDGDRNFNDPDNGMTNVPLRLWTDPNGDGDVSDGSIVSVRVTDVTGYFAFTNVAAGYYVVQQMVPTGFGMMVASDGGTDVYISASVPCGSYSTLTNFVYLDSVLAHIDGQVRNDLDADGDLNDPDSGISGVTVYLYTDPNSDGDPSDGTIIQTTTTDASGTFLFNDVLPGDYVVVEVDLPGWMSTADSSGANDNRVALHLPGGIDYTAYYLDATISGLNILKSSGQADDFDIGQIATYSIIVTNTRNSTQTLVTVSDTLPTTLGYKAGSTRVTANAGYLLDQFNTVAYTNNNGPLSWSGNWTEESDDNNPNAGDVRVELNALRLQNKNKGARRSADLSSYQSATLSMTATILSFDNANDYLSLLISTDTTTWVQLDRWAGPLNATSTVSYDISAYLSSATTVRFTNSASMAADDKGYFDDIRIDVTTSTTGGAPPTLAQNYTLYPGAVMTVTFTASVDEVDDVINEACVSTAFSPTGVCASVSNSVQEIVLTQGLWFVASSSNGAQVGWDIGATTATQRAYDILYADSATPGFNSALTSSWIWADTVTNRIFLDTGSVSRTPPLAMGSQMRFYRIARQGRWGTTNQIRHATKEVYVAKNVPLSVGENWISLFMVPDYNSIERIFGTNSLPAGDQVSDSTVIEWYGATRTGRSTNTIWLSSAGTWMDATGGIANSRSIPLNEGFNLIVPAGRSNQSLLLIGKVPTNSSASYGHVQTLQGSATYNVASYNFPYRVKLKDSGLREAGFSGPASGVANPSNSDELRILQRGGGSMASPKARILMNSSRQFVYWTGGARNASAEDYQLDVDDVLIIYTMHSVSNLNWTQPLPYAAPTVNINP